MVTDQQVRRLFRLSNTEKTQENAASKAAMDVKTAQKYLQTRVLPNERKRSGIGEPGRTSSPMCGQKCESS
jgi:hypothetical protein